MTIKIFNVSLLAIAFLLVISLAAAQENESGSSLIATNESEFLENESSDDSEIEIANELELIDEEFEQNLSFWDIRKERIKNWFTFNEEKKIERELKIAKMLLIRAKIESKNNNSDSLESTLDTHNKILEKVQSRIMERKSESNSTIEAKKLIALEKSIKVHEIRIARLDGLLENENLSLEKKEEIQSRLSRAENLTSKINLIQEKKMEKAKLKIMVQGNLSEEEADNLLDKVEDRAELVALKQIVSEKKQILNERRERIAEKKEKISEKQEELRNRSRLRYDVPDSSSDEFKTELDNSKLNQSAENSVSD